MSFTLHFVLVLAAFVHPDERAAAFHRNPAR